MDHLLASHQTFGHSHGYAHLERPPSCFSIAALPSELPLPSTAASTANPSGDMEEWTAEHLQILSSLLQRRPRPFSTAHRPPPPPQVRYDSKKKGLRRVEPPSPSRKPHQRIKGKGFCLLHLATQMCNGRDVGEVLRESAHLMERGSLSGTILELGRSGMPLAALETFLWQQDYPHLWPDERTLLSTIQVLAEASMEDKARNLMMMMMRRRRRSNSTALAMNHHFDPLPVRFEALIRGLVFAYHLPEALCVKREAESCGYTLRQASYAELILLASQLDRGDVVKNLLEEIGSFPELSLGLEQLTSVMAACRKARIYEAVPGLFAWWKSAGSLPNALMFELVVTSLSSMGKHREALAMYWEMEELGCCLDLLVYKAFLSACAQLRDSTTALRLFSRMKESGIAPDRDVYEHLIAVCCKDGRLGKAREFLDAMRRADMPTSCNLQDYVSREKISL